MSRTFHDVHDGADVTLLNDEAATRVVNWVHAVDNLTDLSQFQILHEIIAQYRGFDQISRPVVNKEKRMTFIRKPLAVSAVAIAGGVGKGEEEKKKILTTTH